MSATNAIINRVKGTSTLVRPRFEPGMLLQHDDLEAMSTYTRELSRLMFRSLFGCGVVCGLVVRTETKCGKVYVVVGAGVALDGDGDPIYVPKDQSVAIDEDCDPAILPPLWVVLCRTSKGCAPRTAMCASDEEETSSVCTRERDGYEIRIVRQLPTCVCHCEPPMELQLENQESDCLCVDPTLPCYVDHYEGICGCNCDDCAGGACDCECVLLARLDVPDADEGTWVADHSVRRFVRPVLMRDPQVARERAASAVQQTTVPVASVVTPAPKPAKPKKGTPLVAPATSTPA
ncbi:MAG TPA: hypothetical protein VGP25_22235 [Gemmatimonadaceae bacterium]|jgi:hypothetical protein|nr:hypothetical protein [Gemmatimonadaceae bacterium]